MRPPESLGLACMARICACRHVITPVRLVVRRCVTSSGERAVSLPKGPRMPAPLIAASSLP